MITVSKNIRSSICTTGCTFAADQQTAKNKLYIGEAMFLPMYSLFIL